MWVLLDHFTELSVKLAGSLILMLCQALLVELFIREAKIQVGLG